MDAALYSILTNHAGLSALVGTRIAPLRLPDGTALPAVTYQRVSERDYWASGTDAGVKTTRYQIDAWGVDYDSCRAVAAQLRNALQRYSGTAASTVVQGIFILTEIDQYADAPKAAHTTIDIEAHHET